MTTSGLTTEFQHAFVAETDVLLRRRLAWFVSIWGGIGFLGFLSIVAAVIAGLALENENVIVTAMLNSILPKNPSTLDYFIVVTTTVGWLAAYGTVLFAIIRQRRFSRQQVVWITIGLIVVDGVIALVMRTIGVPFYGLSYFWMAHIVACCMFPWSLKQAQIPLLVIFPLSYLANVLVLGKDPLNQFFAHAVFSFFFLPGVFVCWWRYSQRMQHTTTRVLHRHYGMMRQELAYARQVHESLFPSPRTDGAIRMSYKYEPMRQIGGDYLHTHLVTRDNGDEQFSLVLLDVTGHGIPAALTVNRLYGEIDIRYAEQPDIDPGRLLDRLNQYVNLTLAHHSIYATALCLRADTAKGVIEYASGGHPPAFLRAADGTIADLEPTTFVLGACPSCDFDATTRSVPFARGDTLLAYTDGAIEARNPDGRMLRIQGLQREIASAGRTASQITQGNWTEHLLRVVTSHRGGSPPEDDTLLVELFRPVN